MSMSDCPKCWNTPCTCGYMGYTVIPHTVPGYIQDEIKELKEEIHRLKAKLEEPAKLRSSLSNKKCREENRERNRKCLKN